MTRTSFSLEHPPISKVPEVTLGFWVTKILATTLGETGGDAVTMTMLHADSNAHNGGYLIGTAIFAAIFVALVAGQVKTSGFHAFLYWATIVATTTLGTTIADFADRSLGVGYPGGVAILFSLLIISLGVWYWSEGSVSVQSITVPRVEWFYWCTIMFSQTLGTALGDWVAGSDLGGLGLGYEYGAVVFSLGLAVVAALYLWTSISHTILFWAAFILTRPLGATLGDYLDKPISQGGLHLSRSYASIILAAVIVICVLAFRQRSARPGEWPLS
jgi:uncharacterized membrane-anchored protein